MQFHESDVVLYAHGAKHRIATLRHDRRSRLSVYAHGGYPSDAAAANTSSAVFAKALYSPRGWTSCSFLATYPNSVRDETIFRASISEPINVPAIGRGPC